jgi:cyclopropane fatty-acyl-phospholipid synthase-like methyltransferase
MTLSTPLFLATDARAYEHFMARWSRRLAGPFLDFAGIKGGNRVLDVGCGTGCYNGGAGGAGLYGRRA